MNSLNLKQIKIAVNEATWLAAGPYSICYCWPVLDNHPSAAS